jgi:hypothetical protein
LEQAARTFGVIREGEHPDGGVYWVESPRRSRHTCSTAPAGLVALGLARHDPPVRARDDLVAFARRCDAFLAGALRRSDDLYADKVDDDGLRDEAVYSYNQGTPVALSVRLYEATGGAAHLAAARRTTAASLAHFGEEDRLWRHEPCFNAIWLRNLLALDAHAHDAHEAHDAVRSVVRAYADRLWRDARHPRTGWFTEGGIGRYGQGGVLDQAGVVQVLVLAATR